MKLEKPFSVHLIKSMPGHRRILFAVDDSVHCQRAFKWFLRWMWRSGARVDASKAGKEGEPLVGQEEEDAITLIHVVSPKFNAHPPTREKGATSEGSESVEGNGEPGAPGVMEEAFTDGKAVCQVFLQLATEAGSRRCDACIAVDRRTETGKVILNSARIRGADMIVVGSHGHGAIHRAVHLDSVSKYITRHSHIPVTIIPSEACPP